MQSHSDIVWDSQLRWDRLFCLHYLYRIDFISIPKFLPDSETNVNNLLYIVAPNSYHTLAYDEFDICTHI